MGYDGILLEAPEIGESILQILLHRRILTSDIYYSYPEKEQFDYTVQVFSTKQENDNQVVAEIILAYKTVDTEQKTWLMYSIKSELECPVAAGCPNFILERLTYTTNALALEWRKIARIMNKVADELDITPDNKDGWETTWEFVHELMYGIREERFPSKGLEDYLTLLRCFR